MQRKKVQEWTLKAFRFRLYPSPEQAQYLQRLIGAGRFLYNLLVEEDHRRRRHARLWGVWPKAFEDHSPYQYYTTARDFGHPWRDDDLAWLREVPGNVANHFTAHFAQGLFSKHTAAPRFKKKSPWGSLQWQDARVVDTLEGPRVRVPTTRDSAVDPLIPFLRHRRTRGTPATATITHQADGWFVSILYRWPARPVRPHPQPDTAVGLDFGVAATVATSDGEFFRLPPSLDDAARKVAHAQRALSRKRRGSANSHKARLPLARAWRRLERTRNDALHKIAHALTERYATIVLEDLRVQAMTTATHGPGRAAKTALNRAISAQGWARLRGLLEYKAARKGGRVIAVPPAFTSQRCSRCQHTDAASRRDQASFVCTACGFACNADVNAAHNILQIYTHSLTAGGGPASACGGDLRSPEKQESLAHGAKSVSRARERSRGTPVPGTARAAHSAHDHVSTSPLPRTATVSTTAPSARSRLREKPSPSCTPTPPAHTRPRS